MPTTTDDLGAQVSLPAPPARVVSLVPSLTEAVALSAPGRLVGATEWCTHPADLDVPRFGGTKNPDLAGIVRAAPDLVVANEEENRAEDLAELRRAGLDVWVTDIRTVDGALDSLHRLLEVLQAPERGWWERARRAWSTIQAPEVPVRALVPIWRRPWMALGSNTYAGDVLRRLGVENVLAGHPDRYPRIDLHQVLAEHEPDLVVLPDEPYRFTAQDGPEELSGCPWALVDGRHLTWYGPAMEAAPSALVASVSSPRTGASHPDVPKGQS